MLLHNMCIDMNDDSYDLLDVSIFENEWINRCSELSSISELFSDSIGSNDDCRRNYALLVREFYLRYVLNKY